MKRVRGKERESCFRAKFIYRLCLHIHKSNNKNTNNSNNDGKSKQPRKTIWWNGFSTLHEKKEGKHEEGTQRTHKKTCSNFSLYSSSDDGCLSGDDVFVRCLLFCNTSYFYCVVAVSSRPSRADFGLENRLICSRKSHTNFFHQREFCWRNSNEGKTALTEWN